MSELYEPNLSPDRPADVSPPAGGHSSGNGVAPPVAPPDSQLVPGVEAEAGEPPAGS